MVDHELEWAASWQLRSDQQEWLGARPRRQALRLTAHRCAASGLDRPSGPSRRQACRNEGAAGKFRAARLTCPIDHIMTPHMDDGEHRREAMALASGAFQNEATRRPRQSRRGAPARPGQGLASSTWPSPPYRASYSFRPCKSLSGRLKRRLGQGGRSHFQSLRNVVLGLVTDEPRGHCDVPGHSPVGRHAVHDNRA
jgi:hypothetical protein